MHDDHTDHLSSLSERLSMVNNNLEKIIDEINKEKEEGFTPGSW